MTPLFGSAGTVRV